MTRFSVPSISGTVKVILKDHHSICPGWQHQAALTLFQYANGDCYVALGSGMDLALLVWVGSLHAHDIIVVHGAFIFRKTKQFYG